MLDNFGNDCYGCIYKITNLMNRKCYIGQTTKNNYLDYINYHFNNAANNSDNKGNGGKGKRLYNAIRKYGKENFKIEILGFCHSQEELNESEIESIWLFRSYGADGENEDSVYGYNRTLGGYGALSNSNPGHKRKGKSFEEIYGEEKASFLRQIRSDLSSGANNAMFGTHGFYEKWKDKYSEDEYLNKIKEVKSKMSGSQKNRKDDRLSPYESWIFNYGKIEADKREKERKNKNLETRNNWGDLKRLSFAEKISKLTSGENSYWFGTHGAFEKWVNEFGLDVALQKFKERMRKNKETWNNKTGEEKLNHKNKIKETKEKNGTTSVGAKNGMAKKFIFISPDGVDYLVHGGFKKFCKDNNLSNVGIRQILNGKRESWKGWRCKIL